MITKDHKKHSDLNRPSYGNYCRNEWSIVGTPCSAVSSLAKDIISALNPQYNCAYADAVHSENEAASLPVHATAATVEYISHRHYHEFNFTTPLNQFQQRQLFNDADIVIVNGNHFEAKAQVVVIDKRKKDSLRKKLSQLTNITLFLLADDEDDIFDFLKEAIPSWEKIPAYRLNETDKIIELFKMVMQHAEPLLYGLVLAGGKSTRMGYDKGLINWHGKEQQYHMADLLKGLCEEVYISCRADQQKEMDSYLTLADTFLNLGPYGAILSAFREKPDVAWLVTACDLPLLDLDTLQYLKQHRNASSMATSFESPYDNGPEPLITIWEPKSYPVLLTILSQGYCCPGKALRNSDVTVLKPAYPDALINVNTPEELKKIELRLKKNLCDDAKGTT